MHHDWRMVKTPDIGKRSGINPRAGFSLAVAGAME